MNSRGGHRDNGESNGAKFRGDGHAPEQDVIKRQLVGQGFTVAPTGKVTSFGNNVELLRRVKVAEIAASARGS